jgi:hypothetical protein
MSFVFRMGLHFDKACVLQFLDKLGFLTFNNETAEWSVVQNILVSPQLTVLSMKILFQDFKTIQIILATILAAVSKCFEIGHKGELC